MAKHNTRTENTLRSLKAIRGVERKAHFEAGGTVDAWRGTHTCTKNGKALANKNACRNQATW